MQADLSPKSYAWILLAAACLLLVLPACERPPQDRTSGSAGAPQPPPHDLSQDESRGGHTLRRHVGRSDEELRKRLEQESDISAASSYRDRAAAESAVGAALEENRSKIERWLARSGAHPNLVLDYDGNPSQPLGRTLRRGENTPQPCAHAVVVLRWDGQGQYYVLTSYPECR